MKLAIALDFPDLYSARAWVQRAVMTQSEDLRRNLVLKVGLELYLAEGPRAVEYLQPYGIPIFLDLKLYDIPNTVAGAVRSVARLGVQYLTIHLAGGKEMIQAAGLAAAEVAKECGHSSLQLLGVSVLTSVRADESTLQKVMDYADLATGSGLSWMVCSAHEARAVLSRFPGLKLVTPGIRFPGENAQDQARVMTPEDARQCGVSMIVMGRSLTRSSDPVQAIQRVFR